MPYSEVANRAQRKYDAAHTTAVMMKLNNKTDSDILEKLSDVENKQGYIKSLIREDISGESPLLILEKIQNEISHCKEKTITLGDTVIDIETSSAITTIEAFLNEYKKRISRT
ncbi:MAG: hypothetical protein IKO61_06275 [Lachnospiraceae bacterium]|nr:hypothetical protein [Lachnospiraceae bacterium]